MTKKQEYKHTKRRSVEASALQEPAFKQKVIPNKKRYDRKTKDKTDDQ